MHTDSEACATKTLCPHSCDGGLQVEPAPETSGLCIQKFEGLIGLFGGGGIREVLLHLFVEL